jgi:hypothetical protein
MAAPTRLHSTTEFLNSGGTFLNTTVEQSVWRRILLLLATVLVSVEGVEEKFSTVV